MLGTMAMSEGDRGDELNLERAERCGSCGATIALAMELCPVCGALLAAYRGADLVPPPPAAVAPAVGQSRPTVVQRPSVQTEPSPAEAIPEPNELMAEVAELLDLQVAPVRPAVSDLQAQPQRRERAAGDAGRVARPVDPAPRAVPAPSRPRRLQPASLRPPRQEVLKRPGFVSVAPVEPIILTALALLAIAFLLFLWSTFTSVRSVGVAALLFGLSGIIALIVGVLALLVQRDGTRH